jgi:RNase P/RNase MRP subunit p30
MKDITLFKRQGAIHLIKISSKKDINDTEDCDGYLIDADEKMARSIIASLQDKKKKKVIALLARDDPFNRRAIETLKINYLVSPERNWQGKKDSLKQRDSGLNHVTAKEAKKEGISIVIDFSYLMKLDKEKASIVLARIIQNIKICRRAKCDIKIATFAKTKKEISSQKNLETFLFSLGASSQQVKQATEF